MKTRLALAVALTLSLAATAGIVIEELPASLSLKQAVRLADGSVLPAGPYSVQIHYKGFGNSAEFWFFQGGVLKGKSPAEARGFPSTAPAGVTGAGQAGFLKIDGEANDKDHKISTVKLQPADKLGTAQTAQKDQTSYKEQKADSAGAVQSFAWGAHGFAPGLTGNALQTGGSVNLSFNSSNSSAGFSALLPAVRK
jgi:hypothetical protein